MGQLGRHPPIGVSSDRDRREESCEELETDRVSGAKRPPDGAGQNECRENFVKIFSKCFSAVTPAPTQPNLTYNLNFFQKFYQSVFQQLRLPQPNLT